MRILKGLRSAVLPCGCLAGVYETYDGEVVTLIDTTGPACRDRTHKDGNPVPDPDGHHPRDQK